MTPSAPAGFALSLGCWNEAPFETEKVLPVDCTLTIKLVLG